MLGKIALAMTSVLLTLLVLEGAARMELLPLPEFVATDAWWQERWHRKRRGLNPREFVKLDADLGFVPAAGLDRLEYEGARISTNSTHMRGKREYPLERTDAARVVVIGDSFAFGECADDADAFPAVMEQTLPNAEVLNLGVMGYGQDQALLRLRRDGFPYSPDVVVFGFHSTDVRRNLVSFRGYAKPRLLLTDDGLVVDNVPVPPPEAFEALWPPRLWNFVEIYRESRHVGSKEWRRHMWDVSRAIVDQMAVETIEAGAVFVVANLPKPQALASEGEYGWNWIQRLCEEKEAELPGQFLCVSPVPRFREIASTKELVQRHFDCHYSPELYRALGEVIAEKLLQELPETFGAAVASASAGSASSAQDEERQ